MLVGIRWRRGTEEGLCGRGLWEKRRGLGQASSWLTLKQGHGSLGPGGLSGSPGPLSTPGRRCTNAGSLPMPPGWRPQGNRSWAPVTTLVSQGPRPATRAASCLLPLLPQQQPPWPSPTWGLPNICPPDLSGVPRLSPQILRASALNPNLFFSSAQGLPLPDPKHHTHSATNSHNPPQAPPPRPPHLAPRLQPSLLAASF